MRKRRASRTIVNRPVVAVVVFDIGGSSSVPADRNKTAAQSPGKRSCAPADRQGSTPEPG
ncbi:hypothetical protein GCM10009836_17340 [Pseudonocardia ailaonensis]|uniref:Uncharacterized protein n=1 Tax=Pseudonocardia ailaonensis TaxID=367279 RepID=A0ABN2MX53_9PSEU